MRFDEQGIIVQVGYYPRRGKTAFPPNRAAVL